MHEAAVKRKHQNKHQQADHGDDFLECGQPGIACQHDEHGGQHAFGNAPENPLVPRAWICAAGTQHIDDQ